METETSHFLQYAVMFLAAAVVAVSVSRRYGLGAVLGYLAAGALIGPHLLNLTPDMRQATELSELGVILLLFIIGLNFRRSGCGSCAERYSARVRCRWR